MNKIGSEGKISQLPPTPEEYKKVYENIQGKKNFVVKNEVTIANLAPQEQALIEGHIIVKPKKSIPNDIQAVDLRNLKHNGDPASKLYQFS